MKVQLKKIFHILDKICSSYLGIKNFTLKPQKVEISNNLFIVTNSEYGQRHLFKKKLSEINISDYSIEDQKKLGLALGKLLGKDITIKFLE